MPLVWTQYQKPFHSSSLLGRSITEGWTLAFSSRITDTPGSNLGWRVTAYSVPTQFSLLLLLQLLCVCTPCPDLIRQPKYRQIIAHCRHSTYCFVFFYSLSPSLCRVMRTGCGTKQTTKWISTKWECWRTVSQHERRAKRSRYLSAAAPMPALSSVCLWVCERKGEEMTRFACVQCISCFYWSTTAPIKLWF